MYQQSGDLQQELEDLLRLNAPYEFAPNIGSVVLDRIDGFYRRYVVYPSDGARWAHVLWTAHCWLMDCWCRTPRLLFISPEPGSGKTVALKLTACLVPHADYVDDLSPAALYHSIDQQLKLNGGRPTILYDELDSVFGEGKANEAMRRLIDGGHERGGTVNRYMGPKRGRVKFPIFGAMALAGKMGIYDVPPTIRTRSVVVKMHWRTADEVVEKWDFVQTPPEVDALRDLLQFWIEFVHGHALDYRAELPKQLYNRDADVWGPLITVADLAGGNWPERARVTAVTSVTSAGTIHTPSRGLQLLADIRDGFNTSQVDKMFTTGLLAELGSSEDSQWAGLHAKTLAQMLRVYEIEPKVLRIGEQLGRGYEKASFVEIWRRYCPR